MLDKLREMFASWKVKVTFAGGVLVVATAFGTCYYNPAETSDDATETVSPAEASAVSSTLTPEEAAALEADVINSALEAEATEAETTEVEAE
tara:strand:- start:522 stop:797 length:276 start_codon:yes stop_codon:yes gene_type:complete